MRRFVTAVVSLLVAAWMQLCALARAADQLFRRALNSRHNVPAEVICAITARGEIVTEYFARAACEIDTSFGEAARYMANVPGIHATNHMTIITRRGTEIRVSRFDFSGRAVESTTVADIEYVHPSRIPSTLLYTLP